MSSQEILFVYKEDYPWDVRVEKIIHALSDFGRKVIVLSNNIKGRESYSIEDRCEVYRIPSMTGVPQVLSRLLKLPIWFNPIWVFKLWKILRKGNIDTVIVRDLPLLKTVLIFKNQYRLKVIYDMAEVYPEMYKSMEIHSNLGVLEKIIKSPKRAAHYEADVIPKVDCVFTVIDESRDRLLKLGYPSERTFIVSNTPSKAKVVPSAAYHRGGTLNIVYVGCITRLRGLDLLIRAINELVIREDQDANVHLDVIGTGPAKYELINLCNDMSLSAYVRIHGWLDQSDVDQIISGANLGVLTYRVCGHWNHTIPNKIFDYMAAGLPVLATPVIPIKRVIEISECGIVTANEAPESICDAFLKLRDPRFRIQLGENGRRAILDGFNWEEEVVTMRKALEFVDNQ